MLINIIKFPTLVIEEFLRFFTMLKKINRNYFYSALTEEDIAALKLITKARKGESLTIEEQEIVRKFIESAISNIDLNKKMGVLLKQTPTEEIDRESIRSILEFTFRSRSKNKFSLAVEKLNKNWSRIQNQMILEESHRLNLSEYGAIVNIIKAYDIIKGLKLNFLFENEGKLKKLFQNAEESKTIIEEFNKTMIEERTALDTGDLVFTCRDKVFEFRNRKKPLQSYIQNLFSKYKHVAAILKIEGGTAKRNYENLQLFHINPNLIIEPFQRESLLYSDVYKISVAQLIQNQALCTALEEYYGKAYITTIDQMYKETIQELSKTIHTRYRHMNAREQLFLQLKLGLTEITGIQSRRSKDKDFHQEYIDIKSGNSKKMSMTCTKFVACLVRSAITGLDIKLKQALKIDNPDSCIVKMPFDKRERLSVMSPERLLHILKESRCLEKVEPTPIEQKIFKPSIPKKPSPGKER